MRRLRLGCLVVLFDGGEQLLLRSLREAILPFAGRTGLRISPGLSPSEIPACLVQRTLGAHQDSRPVDQVEVAARSQDREQQVQGSLRGSEAQQDLPIVAHDPHLFEPSTLDVSAQIADESRRRGGSPAWLGEDGEAGEAGTAGEQEVALVSRRASPAAAQDQDQLEVVDLHHPVETRAQPLSLQCRSRPAKLAKAQHSDYLWHPGQ